MEDPETFVESLRALPSAELHSLAEALVNAIELDVVRGRAVAITGVR